MNVHLYTTDISALELLFPARDRVSAIITPANRGMTDKVQALSMAAAQEGFDQYIHEKGGRTTDMDGYGLPHGDADIAVSWMYTQLFSDEVLAKYPLGILNFHAGEPGPHAFRRAIEARHTSLRCFWHRCVSEVDAGPVFAERMIGLWYGAYGDSTQANRDAMIGAGRQMFPDAWAAFRPEIKHAGNR